MKDKSRFSGTELPTDIPAMIDKLCGKSDRSKHILHVMAFNTPPTMLFRVLHEIDACGLWGDRLFWLCEVADGPDILLLLGAVHAHITQDEFIAVKSQDEMFWLCADRGIIETGGE